MSKDQLKSLVNSVAVLKEMVENIIKVVEKRFSEIDAEIANLNAKINSIETASNNASRSVVSTLPETDELKNRLQILEKRVETLNQNILLSVAAKSSSKTSAPPTAPAPSSSAPPAPPTAPATRPVSKMERDVSPISKEVPSSPIPTPPHVSESSTMPSKRLEKIANNMPGIAPSKPEDKESEVSGDKAELLKALKKLEEI